MTAIPFHHIRLIRQKISRNVVLIYFHKRIGTFPMAGNKIDSAFQHHAHGFQRRETDRAGAAGLKDPSGRLGADAWNSQQCLVVRPGDLYRKLLQMSQCPVALRIQVGIEKRTLFREKFLCLETIKTEKKVSLVQTVFPPQRWSQAGLGHGGILIHIDKGRVKYSF